MLEADNAKAAREFYATRKKVYPRLAIGTYRTIKWLVMAVTLGIYYLLPNFANFRVSAWVSNGHAIASSMIFSNTLYAACYCSFLLIGAAAMFSRRDLK